MPAPVLVELSYWISKTASAVAWLEFCQDLQAGAYDLFHLDTAAVVESARLQERYEDLQIGFVDAAVFTTCELLGETKVATLDHRHFSVLRTADGGVLRLLPEWLPHEGGRG